VTLIPDPKTLEQCSVK